MYDELIKKLLRQVEILPETVIVVFLLKKFPALSVNQAQQAVHAACRNRACYKKGENIARTPYIEWDSSYEKKAKALRIWLEIAPQSEFSCSLHPWLITFVKGSYMVQVCYIEKDMELVSSMVIAGKPIPTEDRSAIKRIAIVDASCNLNAIKKAGFSHFCTVDNNYKVEIIKKIDASEAWKDVSVE